MTAHVSSKASVSNTDLRLKPVWRLLLSRRSVLSSHGGCSQGHAVPLLGDIGVYVRGHCRASWGNAGCIKDHFERSRLMGMHTCIDPVAGAATHYGSLRATIGEG